MVPLLIEILSEGTIPAQNTFISSRAPIWTGANTTFNDIKIETQSPIYVFVQDNVSSYITISIGVFCYAMWFIIFSNAIEGIIYWYIWSYTKR